MAQINKLTDRKIKAIKPTEKEQNKSDGDSLYIRVNPIKKGGAISFYYRYTFVEKPRKISIGPYPTISLKEARQIKDGFKHQIARGIDPGEAKKQEKEQIKAEREFAAKQSTVLSLYDGWMKNYIAKNRKDGGSHVEYMLKKDVIDRIGHIKLDDVKVHHITSVLDDMVASGVNRKANAALSLLKQMFKYAVRRGQITSDPTYSLAKRDFGGTEKPVERALSFDEISELIKKLPTSGITPRLQSAIFILLGTGCRVGELVKAKWSDFDFKSKTWTIPAENSKNNTEHVIHISKFVLNHVEHLLQYRCNEYLLSGKKDGMHINDKAITKAIKDRCRDKPLKNRTQNHDALILEGGGFTPHDLRRTMASRMGDLCVAPHIIEKCLNHTPERIVAVYQRQEYLIERRLAFELWGAKLDEIREIRQKEKII